jgi:hypothetical protein
MKQPCLDCGTPTSGTRCPTHLRAHLHKRDTRQTAARKQQGGRPKYGGTYRGEAAAVRATATVCWLCTYGPRADDPWQADHIRQFDTGGRGGGAGGSPPFLQHPTTPPRRTRIHTRTDRRTTQSLTRPETGTEGTGMNPYPVNEVCATQRPCTGETCTVRQVEPPLGLLHAQLFGGCDAAAEEACGEAAA